MMLRLGGAILAAMMAAASQPQIAAVSRHGSGAHSIQTSEIPKGQIVEKVVCANDSAQSYALYLPSNYKPELKWPILYAFDPGARGKAPVEHFKEAAEKYGWIVVGSNNSRNGPLRPSADAWNAISRDTHLRFAIDDERVYATGLSGGARMAVMFANLCHDCVAGVIAFGAVFHVGITPSSSMHFLFFGTVGVDDFNFSEVMDLDDALTRTGLTHRVEVFEGRHEWAPSAVATEAVEWMELQATKSGRRKRDDGLIAAIWQQRVQQATALEDSKKDYEAFQVYRGLADDFKGLRDVGDVEKKVIQLRDSREVKDAIRAEQQQIRKQRDIEKQMRDLIAALESPGAQAERGTQNSGPPGTNAAQGSRGEEAFDPETRWQGTLAELRKQSKATEDAGDRRVARRVLEGLFIGLGEQGLDLLQTEKRYGDAARTFSLAAEVNPDRAGVFFYLAWAHAANGDKKKSLQALKTAVEKGFSDLAAIRDNRAFDSLRDDPQYQQIISIVEKINVPR